MPEPRVQTFDTKRLSTSFGGTLLTGFAQEVIRVRYDVDPVQDEAGADGETVRFLLNDLRAAITLQFQPTSRSNFYLSGIRNSDQITGDGILPFLMKDELGDDVVSAPQAWIATWPEVIRRKGIEPHNWVLRTNNLAMVLGGTSQ